jgi:hypothetical protein
MRVKVTKAATEKVADARASSEQALQKPCMFLQQKVDPFWLDLS